MGIVSDIIGSFYSAGFYNHVARARRGIGMKFIFALTLIAVLLITGFLVFYSGTLNSIAAGVPAYAANLPAVSVKGGKFSMDKPSPYNLPIGTGADRVWISVDTNYKPADLNALRSFMETNHMIMLITANEFITSKKDNALEVHSFSDFKTDVSVTHEQWAKLADFIVKNGVKILIIATLVTTFIGLLIYNLLATFIGALVMMLISLVARAGLEFGAAMRLTAAARMPYSAIIAAPLMMGGGHIAGIAGWLIWLGYLVFATVSAKAGANG